MPYQKQTSGAAYKNDVLPSINDKQAKVLEAIRNYQILFGTAPNDRDIVKFIQWPINCVTPRRNELAAKGLIVEAYQKRDPDTNRNVSYWKVAEGQLSIF